MYIQVIGYKIFHFIKRQTVGRRERTEVTEVEVERTKEAIVSGKRKPIEEDWKALLHQTSASFNTHPSNASLLAPTFLGAYYFFADQRLE